MAAEGDRATSWQKCRLPHNLDALEAFDALEVVRLALSLQSGSPVQKQAMSEEAKRARDALAESPHSMLCINELGRVYADEAQWDKCEIALLRGWKRASEIEDLGVRLCFLMKLCEVSFYLRKYKQALAVLKDIDEPDAPDELQAFLLLACRVHACNNDLEGAMRFFSRVIEKENFRSALKVLALTMFDLHKAGAYEPAKHALESMAGSRDKDQLRMFDDALEQRGSPKATTDQLVKYALMGVKALAVLLMVFLLYRWEQRSLDGWAKAKAGQEL
jgi:tetratricopeptide (TPR) repeat protein